MGEEYHKNGLLRHLEESLELMESEFESLENYWQQKLDAERVYYEELRKQNDIHCEEMELRIKGLKNF